MGKWSNVHLKFRIIKRISSRLDELDVEMQVRAIFFLCFSISLCFPFALQSSSCLLSHFTHPLLPCVMLFFFSLSLSLSVRIGEYLTLFLFLLTMAVIWLPLVFTASLYMYNCFANPSFRMLLLFWWSIHVPSLLFSFYSFA